MSQPDLARFRRMCAQFRWLAVFMVLTVGLLLALMHLVGPITFWLRFPSADGAQDTLSAALRGVPGACYLFAVWSIGAGLGQLGRGRLIQPTLASTLRRVGIALGVGGVFSVFVMINLLRLIGSGGGYLMFDVAGMTLGMIGGALFLLGRVIDQAGRVQAELDEMV